MARRALRVERMLISQLQIPLRPWVPPALPLNGEIGGSDDAAGTDSNTIPPPLPPPPAPELPEWNPPPAIEPVRPPARKPWEPYARSARELPRIGGLSVHSARELLKAGRNAALLNAALGVVAAPPVQITLQNIVAVVDTTGQVLDITA